MLTVEGILTCLDGYMNIALEQTEEHVNGKVTNRYGDAFIRGNNGKCVSRCPAVTAHLLFPQYCTFRQQNQYETPRASLGE